MAFVQGAAQKPFGRLHTMSPPFESVKSRCNISRTSDGAGVSIFNEPILKQIRTHIFTYDTHTSSHSTLARASVCLCNRASLEYIVTCYTFTYDSNLYCASLYRSGLVPFCSHTLWCKRHNYDCWRGYMRDAVVIPLYSFAAITQTHTIKFTVLHAGRRRT